MLVVAGVGDHLRLRAGRREVEDDEAKGVARARDVGERSPVGAHGRADVVAAAEGDALGRAAARGHAVDLRRAAAVAREVEPAAVGAVLGLGVDRRARRETARIAAVPADREQLRAAFARERHGKALAVGRPRRRAVRAAEIGDRAALAAGDVVDEDDRLLALERDVGELLAVRRPRRRDDRLAAVERDLAVLAVGVGDAQGVAGARARDVGDAGREDALLAGQLLVDEVGDAVRRQAQVAGLDGAALAAELAALDDVPELEADVVAAVGEARHRAGDERVGGARAPGRHLRARALVEAGRRGVDDAKDAASFEVGADDRRG